MRLMLPLSLIYLILSAMLMALAAIIGKKSTKDREKLSPFECGFDPVKKARAPFSLRFFLITIIFLIFDVEIVLILPLGFAPTLSSMVPLLITSTLVVLILVLGLVHEWTQGSLNWIY